MGKALSYVVNLFYSLVRNTLPGTTGYHRALTHVDSADGAAIFNGVASKLPGQTAAGIELFWNALIEVIIEYLVTYQYRLTVCGNTFALAIPGSTESVNGTPSDGAYVTITPSAAMRNAVSGIKPVYRADGSDMPVLKSVGCLAGNVLDQISGTDRFRLTGSNITAAGDDETITVIACDGTEAVAVVDAEDGLGSFITAHLPAALPSGKGKVVLMTHGKRTPEGELNQCVKSVTIVAGESPSNPPRITSGHSESHADDGKCYADGSGFVLEGENLEDAIVTVAGSANEGETWSYEETVPADKVNFDADMLTIDGDWLDTWYNHLDVGELVKFTVETTQGEDSITRTLSA